MGPSSLMQGWAALLGSLAIIAIVLTAFGLMLGIVRLADAMRYIGATLGIVIVLMLMPCIMASAWSDLSLWQQLALIAIGVCVWQLRRARRQTRNKRGK
jgi:hypothetical protein